MYDLVFRLLTDWIKSNDPTIGPMWSLYCAYLDLDSEYLSNHVNLLRPSYVAHKGNLLFASTIEHGRATHTHGYAFWVKTEIEYRGSSNFGHFPAFTTN